MRALPVFSLLCAMLASGPAFARSRPAPIPSPQPSPTAVPTAQPPPPTHAARVAQMHARLEALAREAPGRLGIAVADLQTDERFAIRGDESFALANLTVLPIAIAAYRLADQRKYVLDDRVLITRGDLRRGTSAIARDHPNGGLSVTNWQLLRAMIVETDTTASDVVSRAVGGPAAIRAILTRLHARGVDVRKTEAEAAADERAHRPFARDRDNAATPAGFADLLAGLVTQRFTLLDSTTELFHDLSDANEAPTRMRAGVPPALAFAHEAGTSATVAGITEATNDAGILTLRDGRRIAIVAFLADSRATATERDATLARVASIVVDAYVP